MTLSLPTLAEFTDYLKNETGAGDAPQVQAALDAGIGFVRQHCQRSFETATGTATARTFGPDNVYGCSLRVDDIANLTGLVVSNNGTTVTSGEYTLLPLNGLSAGAYAPYTDIDIYPGYWYRYTPRPAITVTANWGWTSVPAPVVEAVKIVGKDYITARQSKFGYVETGVGPAAGGRNWIAINSLAPFRRVEAFGIA